MVPLFVLMLLLDLAIVAVAPAEILDVRLYYSGAEAASTIAKYTPAERAQYMVSGLLDFALMATYTRLLFIAAARLWPARKLRWGMLAPAIWDVLETGSILTILTFPAVERVYPYGALGVFTCAKWVCVFIAVGVLAGGIFLRWRQGRLREFMANGQGEPAG